MPNGITVKFDSRGARVEVRSQNQAGLIYAVPAEASWVASPDQLHAHAIAGFFNDLAQLNLPEIRRLMDKWGLFYRPLDLEPLEQPSDSPA